MKSLCKFIFCIIYEWVHVCPTYSPFDFYKSSEKNSGRLFENGDGRNFSMSGPHYLPTYQIWMISDNVEFLRPFWKWRLVEIFQCRDIIIYPHIKFWWYRTMLIFYAVFWQPFWKFWKRRIAPLMVTYHYVKFYVSIIIHLEVININVRNFNFPIGFYSNPHPINSVTLF